MQVNRCPPQQNILFYSSTGCGHSKAFIDLLKRHQVIYFSFDLVDVQKNKGRLPKYVTRVPTLVLHGIDRPLVGESALFWLQTEINKSSNGRTSGVEQRPQIATSGPISDMMGTVGSDDSIFASVEGNNTLSNGSFSYLGNDQKINTGCIQSEIIAKPNKVSDGDYERFMQERELGVKPPHRRM